MDMYDYSGNINTNDQNRQFCCDANNTPKTATPLVDQNRQYFRNLRHWETKLDANLYDTVDTGNDFDYYYFTLYSDTKIDLSFTFDGGFANSKYYRIELIQLQYGCHTSKNTQFLSVIASYVPYGERVHFSDEIINTPTTKNATKKAKVIHYENNEALQGGTYFICLQSTMPKSLEGRIKYSLDLKADVFNRDKSYKINDLRYNKDVKGALWCADFRPAGLSEATLDFDNPASDVPIGSICHSDEGLDYPDYCLKNLESDIGSRAFCSDVLYIWDSKTAQTLKNYVNNLVISLLNKKEEAKERLDKAEDIEQFTTSVFEVVDDAVFIADSFNLVDPSKAIELLWKIITVVATTDLANKARHAKEEYDAYFYLVQILSGLCTALSWKVGSGINVNSRNEGDTLVIPLTLCCLSEGNLNFGYLVNPCDSDDFFLDRSDYMFRYSELSSVDANGIGGTGKLYAFGGSQDKTSLEDCRDVYKEAIEFPGEGGSIETAKAIKILADEDYLWYQFTAPKKGIYLFSVVSNPIDGVDLVPAVIEVFPSVVPGHSLDSMIGSSLNTNYGSYYYSYFDYPMEGGETVCLRVRGENYLPAATVFEIENIDEASDHNDHHVHTAGEFAFMNPDRKTHTVFCWKDGTIMGKEKHTYEGTYDDNGELIAITCTKCLASIEYRMATLPGMTARV